MRSIYGIFKRNDINVTIYDPVALDRAASGEWRVASGDTAEISHCPSRANSLASRGRLLKWIVTRVLLQLVLLLRINKIVDMKSKLDHNIFYQLFLSSNRDKLLSNVLFEVTVDKFCRHTAKR